MYGKLVSYKILKKEKRSKAVALCRDIYGYKDISNMGQYTYKRKGILDSTPHIKLPRSVFIIKNTDLNTFVRALNKHKVKHNIRTVTLKEKDKKILR